MIPDGNYDRYCVMDNALYTPASERAAVADVLCKQLKLKRVNAETIATDVLEAAARADMQRNIQSFSKLQQSIISWASERGILEKATPASQFEKTVEEIGELARALIENNESMFIDAVGDVIVTLIILCELKDHDVVGCLSEAYEQIAGRKGKMVNGVFVKDE